MLGPLPKWQQELYDALVVVVVAEERCSVGVEAVVDAVAGASAEFVVAQVSAPSLVGPGLPHSVDTLDYVDRF